MEECHKIITVKVPLVTYGRTKGEANRSMRNIRSEIDFAVRQYVAVGRRSKAVTTTLEEPE